MYCSSWATKCERDAKKYVDSIKTKSMLYNCGKNKKGIMQAWWRLLSINNLFNRALMYTGKKYLICISMLSFFLVTYKYIICFSFTTWNLDKVRNGPFSGIGWFKKCIHNIVFSDDPNILNRLNICELDNSSCVASLLLYICYTIRHTKNKNVRMLKRHCHFAHMLLK